MRLKPLFYVYLSLLLFLLIGIHVCLYIYQVNGGNPNWLPLFIVDAILGPFIVYWGILLRY